MDEDEGPVEVVDTVMVEDMVSADPNILIRAILRRLEKDTVRRSRETGGRNSHVHRGIAFLPILRWANRWIRSTPC